MDGMSVALSEEHRMLKDLVARFVDDELMPLERAVLEREAAGQGYSLTPEERARIDRSIARAGPVGPRRAGGHSAARTCRCRRWSA